MPFPSRRVGLVILAIAVAAYCLAGFLVARVLVRRALVDEVGRTLTTRPALQRVRVNPLVLLHFGFGPGDFTVELLSRAVLEGPILNRIRTTGAIPRLRSSSSTPTRAASAAA